MRDELTGLLELLTVAEKRSFTAAAAQLRVTPSAISQSVRGLEARLGVRLLQRTTRSVGLTEAGERFLARLKPALADVQSAIEDLGELRDKPAGLLRLTLPRLGYEQVLAPKLAGFMREYPEVALDVSLDDAFVNIVEHGFDAGIRIGEMVEREMIAVPVSAPLRSAVVAAPSYFAKRPKPKHPRDLRHHACINYRRRASGEVYRWEFTEQGKDFELAVEGRLLINDSDAMLRAALEGLGVAYLIEFCVERELAERRLVRVLDSFCPPFPGFFLYYPSRQHLAPKLQALVDWLRVKRRR